jgi:DNA-binding protein YbaB
MGIIDMTKALRKAQQTKNAMKNIQAVGQSKSKQTALLLNGINEIIELNFEDELIQKGDAKAISKEVIQAYDEARKDLEKQMAESMNMDDLRDLLSAA